MIQVKCFGVAKEIIDREILEVDQSSMTVEELRKHLNAEFADFSSINGYMVAINQEYATDDMTITVTDEVAIIPPVSGG